SAGGGGGASRWGRRRGAGRREGGGDPPHPSGGRDRRASGDAPPASVGGSAARVEAVVTHHRDGFRSGVARFSELLDARLGVPLYGVDDDAQPGWGESLFSFKGSEMGEWERDGLAERIRRVGWRGGGYLNEWTGLDLEREIVDRARRVHAGNLEIHDGLSGVDAEVDDVWTPGLLVDRRDYEPAELSVFSFGMAHKI